VDNGGEGIMGDSEILFRIEEARCSSAFLPSFFFFSILNGNEKESPPDVLVVLEEV